MINLNVIEIKNLSKDIKGTTILNGININFVKGNIYGIVGRNGSGKSMLFKAISGLINPSSGEIKVFDQIIKDGNFPQKTGVIIEHPGFLPQYSAFENLKILASINNKISHADIKKFITLVGLDCNDKKPIKKFSLGMKQRLGIAQALMENPELLILDEPMNGLDPDGVNLIRSILLNLKKKGVTILLASHNNEDIDELCDSVYKMENGILTQIN